MERLYYVEIFKKNGNGSYELFGEENLAKENFKKLVTDSIENYSIAEISYGEARVLFNGHGVNELPSIARKNIKNYDIAEIINVERTVTFDRFKVE